MYRLRNFHFSLSLGIITHTPSLTRRGGGGGEIEVNIYWWKALIYGGWRRKSDIYYTINHSSAADIIPSCGDIYCASLWQINHTRWVFLKDLLLLIYNLLTIKCGFSTQILQSETPANLFNRNIFLIDGTKIFLGFCIFSVCFNYLCIDWSTVGDEI